MTNYAAQGDAPPPGAIVKVDLPQGQKKIALTVDLCATKNTPSLYDKEYFDTLRGVKDADGNRIHFTIFPSGKWMREHPAEMKEFMRDPNVQIGTHGDTHQALTLVKDKKVLDQEFDKPLAEYKKLLGELKKSGKATRTDGSAIPETLTAMREPWGYNSQGAMDEAKAHHENIIHWTTTADGIGQMTPTMENITAKGKSGAIVLTHGNHNTKHDAGDVKRGIEKALGKGYEFTTIDEMLSTPGAKPERTVKHADVAAGEKITTSDILTAAEQNETGSKHARQEVKGWSKDKKDEVLHRFEANTPRGP